MDRKLKILLIDDDEKIHEVVRDTLPDDEFELETALESREGLHEVLRFSPDLILLDYILPEISGMDALRELKSHKLTKKIPVLVLSSAGNQDIVESFYQLGAIDFIDKPIIPRILREKIRSLSTNMDLLQRNINRAGGNIVGFFGAKGGVGTSTVATNSGLLLSKMADDEERTVLLMDVDKFSSSLRYSFDVRSGATLFDLMQEHPFDLDGEYMLQSLTSVSDNLSVMPSSNKLGQLEQGNVDDFAVVMQIVTTCFDHVIVDMDNSFSDINLWLFEHAANIMIVTTTARSSLQNLHGTVETLLRIGIDRNKLGLVLNRFDPRDKINEDELLKFVGIPCLGTFRNHPEKYIEAEENSIPIAALTRSPATAEYKKFAEVLIDLAPSAVIEAALSF